MEARRHGKRKSQSFLRAQPAFGRRVALPTGHNFAGALWLKFTPGGKPLP
jgi:hypothetical protein